MCVYFAYCILYRYILLLVTFGKQWLETLTGTCSESNAADPWRPLANENKRHLTLRKVLYGSGIVPRVSHVKKCD